MNDAELDTLLAKKPAYLEDAGFTERVVAGLPRPRPFWRRRPFVLSVGTAVALIVGLVLLPGGQAIVEAVDAVATWIVALGLAAAGHQVSFAWDTLLPQLVAVVVLVAGAVAFARAVLGPEPQRRW